MDIKIIPFKFLPKSMKDERAKETLSLFKLVIDLKKTKKAASTYLLSGSPENYLNSVGKNEEDYDFVPVSSSYSGFSANSWNYDLLEDIEASIDKDRRLFEKHFKGEKYPEVKLFEGGRYPDMGNLFAEQDLIAEAKELGAEIVVGVKPQYTDRFLGHSVYLNAIALVPCIE